jgi:hypothetical protein
MIGYTHSSGRPEGRSKVRALPRFKMASNDAVRWGSVHHIGLPGPQMAITVSATGEIS